MVVGAWAVVGGTAAILAPAAGAWAVLPVVGACALLPWLTGRMLAAAALLFVGACATVNDRLSAKPITTYSHVWGGDRTLEFHLLLSFTLLYTMPH